MTSEFRIMNLELSRALKKDECEEIVYLYHLVTPQALNFNLKVLSSLEANGHTSPWKVDELEDILRTIHRLDLLPIITRYKETKEYKDALKDIIKKESREGRTFKLSNSACRKDKDYKWMMESLCTLLTSHAQELILMLDMLSEVKKEESGDQDIDENRELWEVARVGEEFTKNLKRILRIMHTRQERSTTSSEETPTSTVMPGTFKDVG